MKTKQQLLFGLAAPALMLIAGTASAALVATSAHNLAGTALVDNGQVCAYCHTPHKASATVSAPLWNHTPTAAAFTMYDSTFSSTIDMTVAGSPEGSSLACLSCHDGTIALDSLVNPPAGWSPTLSPVFMGAGKQVGGGGDLTKDHPISIGYDNVADPAFVAPVGSNVGALPLFAGGTSPNQVECATCHSVHDDAINPFLRTSNAASALCYTCHVK